ncbi:hypothetical protein D3C74_426570 [compost metagenome]
MRSPHDRNIKTSLSPDCRPCRVRMHDAANLCIMLVQYGMGWRIRGRSEIAFNHIAVEIHNHHIAGLHCVIMNAARFDYEQAACTVNRAYIAPRVFDKPVFRQVQIGLEHLFFQML